jgi:serine/threonine protein kinase
MRTVDSSKKLPNLIIEDYEILKVIGQGSNAKIYQVRDKQNNKFGMKKLDFTTFGLYIIMELADKDWKSDIKSKFKDKKYYKEAELLSIIK